MSSSPSLPWASSSLSSPQAATSTAVTESAAKLAAWQPALYLVVVLVIFAIIAGTILLIWNDDWLKLTRRRAKMEATTRHDSAFFFPSASTLVEKMLKYFFASLMPAFRHLTRATTSLASVAPRRLPSQPALPLYRPPGFREPPLATPLPAMARDSSSFRVQSNPYSDSEPSMTTLPVASSPSIPTFLGPAGSPPS